MKFKILPMLLALSVLPASTVWADDEIETGQVVISATRTEQFIEDVPTTMEVVTAEDIKQMGAATLTDALSAATGLSMNNQKSSVNIRGMGFSTGFILVNGRRPARLESNHDGIGFLVATIGVDNIERIEIIRGQASAMYGADAIAGIVNIITKRGSTEPSGSVTVQGGNSQLISSFVYNTGDIGNFDASVSGSATQNMGLHSETEGNVENEDGTWGSNGKGFIYTLGLDAGYHFNADHELRFIGSFTQQESISYSKGTYETDAGSTDDVKYRSIGTERIGYNTALEYNGTVGDHSFRISPFASQSIHNPAFYNSTYWSWSSKNGWTETTGSAYYFTNFGVDFQDTWAVNDWNLVSVGGQYQNSSIVHPNADTNSNAFGVYLQDEMFLFNDSLIVLPSIRYDYDQSFGGAVTPRLGLTYEFINNHRLKANVGTAYVAPTLVQAYGAETQSVGIVYGIDTLSPQTTFGWELRYEANPIAGLNLGIGYFNTQIKDQIGSELIDNTHDLWDQDWADANTSSNQYVRYNNPDIVLSQGIEAEISYTIGMFTPSFSYNWIDNKTKADGIRTGYYAPHSFIAKLSFYEPESKFSANIWGNYDMDYTQYAGGLKSGSAEDEYGNPYIFDFYNLNASFSKDFMDKYSATLAFYNILTPFTDLNNLTRSSFSAFKFNLALTAQF